MILLLKVRSLLVCAVIILSLDPKAFCADEISDAAKPVNKDSVPNLNKDVKQGDSDEVALAVAAFQAAESRGGFRGNWLKKFAWLKQGAEVNAHTLALSKEITLLRSQAYAPKIEAMKGALQKFYISSKNSDNGLSASILQLQNDVEEKLNKLQDLAKKADLEDVQQNARFKVYAAEDAFLLSKNKLSLLKMDIGVVEELQKSFHDRVALLDSFINKAEEIEKSSEQKVQELYMIVDHDRARDGFVYIQGLNEQMKSIHKYVKEDALKLFDSEQASLLKEIARLNEDLDKIRAEINNVSGTLTTIEKSLAASESVSAESPQGSLVNNQVALQESVASGLKVEQNKKALPRSGSVLFQSEWFLYSVLLIGLLFGLTIGIFFIRWIIKLLIK